MLKLYYMEENDDEILSPFVTVDHPELVGNPDLTGWRMPMPTGKLWWLDFGSTWLDFGSTRLDDENYLEFTALEDTVFGLLKVPLIDGIALPCCLTDLFDIKLLNQESENADSLNGDYICKITKGNKIRLKGKLPTLRITDSYYRFVIKGLMKISGNISSLITGDDYYFPRLFKGCDIINTPKFTRILTVKGYSYMFKECEYLVDAEELIAEYSKISCYEGMFEDCVNLIRCPDIYVKYLEYHCFYSMFQRCKSLEIPANFVNRKINYNNVRGNNCFEKMYINTKSKSDFYWEV